MEKVLFLEKKRLRKISSQDINIGRDGAKKMEPGTLQWWPLTDQEATGTN